VPRARTAAEVRILEAANRAVGRHGPVKVSFAAVAREAGLSPALVVRIFGSKHNLLLALAARTTETTAAVFARALESDDGPLAALHDALAAPVEAIGTREELLNHLALLHFQLADPDLRRHARATERAVREGVEALLAAAVAAGDLRPGTDARALARAVQVAHHGSMVTWTVAGDGPLADALRADVEAVLAPHRT
jgi:AcrR family transcriptional regulator